MSPINRDPHLADRLQQDRKANGLDARDEIWDGAYVVSPMADFEHQRIVSELTAILTLLISWPGLGQVLAGCNVSDRDLGWEKNYRIPDVAVFLKGGVGVIQGTHSRGGPDFLIEVLSVDDPAPDKLPFYAANGVREAIFIRRAPWAIELYRLEGGILRLAESSTSRTSGTGGLYGRADLNPPCARYHPSRTPRH